MPGTLPTASAGAGVGGGGNSAGGIVEFEVDRNEPTTQVQIRLRNGERYVLLPFALCFFFSFFLRRDL